MGYELIDHTADIGIRVCGADARELFATAGCALFDQVTERAALGGGETIALEVEGADWPDLMVNWLRELLFLWSGSGMLVKEIEVAAVSETRVSARLKGERYDPGRHVVKTEIKAVTYHRIAVAAGPTGWEATVIFDI